MSKITPSATVTPSPGVLVQDLPDGEIVLLSMATETYFGLDGVGAEMWGRLSEGKPIRTMAEELCSEYDVDPEALEGDLLDLVGQLVEAGLAFVGDG